MNSWAAQKYGHDAQTGHATIKFFELTRQYPSIREEIQQALIGVLERGMFVLGPECRRFEEAFAAYLGGGFVVSVGSGTDALYLSLAACDVADGDEVITVSNSFIATHCAIEMTGAKSVFIDIDPCSYTLDTDLLEAAITPRTKAIVPVHLYGQPANMDAILRIANRWSIPVIEDACQAHGAEWQNVKAGTLGRAGCFSFYPTKNLGAYGDGGAIFTRDGELYERLLRFRNYGQVRKYIHDSFGINSRLDELQAAVLQVKLRYLDQWNDHRRRVADEYSERLRSCRFVTCPVTTLGARHVYHLYVVKSPLRDQLMAYLRERGIETMVHYPIPIHKQKCYTNSRAEVFLPATEMCAAQALSLPIGPDLSVHDIDRVTSCVLEFEATVQHR